MLNERTTSTSSRLPSPSGEASEEESATADRSLQEDEGSWVQCLKGLPLKINEKYTEIRHLWSGKFARKTQRAVFCLNESNWSNSLQRKGGRSRGRVNARWQNFYPRVEMACRVLQWKDRGSLSPIQLNFSHLHKEIKPFSMNLWLVRCMEKKRPIVSESCKQ